MGNCLKTQLKESVNNDNLDFFDCLRVEYKSLSEKSIYTQAIKFLSNVEDIEISIVGGNGNFKLGTWDTGTPIQNTTITIPKGTNPTYSLDQTSDVILKVKSKYKIDTVNITSAQVFDLKDFEWCNLLTKIQASYASGTYITGTVNSLAKLTNLTHVSFHGFSNINGDIESFVGATQLTELDLEGTSVRGNLSSLVNTKQNLELLVLYNNMLIESTTQTLGTFTSLKTLNCGFTGNITGEISNLSTLVNLTTLNISWQSGIFGTIESLASAMAANRASGELTVNAVGASNITYNDAPIERTLVITFTGNGNYSIS